MAVDLTVDVEGGDIIVISVRLCPTILCATRKHSSSIDCLVPTLLAAEQCLRLMSFCSLQ